jgi:hypothetical protein
MKNVVAMRCERFQTSADDKQDSATLSSFISQTS